MFNPTTGASQLAAQISARANTANLRRSVEVEGAAGAAWLDADVTYGR